MAKAQKTSSSTSESEAFEMIELATNDINTLARAFDVITAVCTELNNAASKKNEEAEKVVLN